MRWYQYTKNQIETELKTNAEKGLSLHEAAARLKRDGLNLLPERPPESWLAIFLRQFKSPLIYLLLVCGAVVFYLGEVVDSVIIAVVLSVNAAIGAFQEGRAGKILQSLKKLSFAEATVLRDGQEIIVPEAEVCLGDILLLSEGQKVVADARVIFSSNLKVDEAALTGESGAVLKHEAALGDTNLPASSRRNMVFKGTQVLAGNGQAVVVGVAQNTEMGKISRALLMPEELTPLQKNIQKLSKVIIYFVVLISITLFFLGLNANIPPREMFALVVSLALSVIPEGLPVILTLILAHGVWRMSKKHALVKKLQAVEALGQATVLAVDKTGTITENQMVIKELFVAGKIYKITGNGYEPKGLVFLGDVVQTPRADIKMAATIAGLTGKAAVQLLEQAGTYKVSGDPTEAAILVFAEKLGFAREVLLEHYLETGEIPFEYKNKYHAVFYEHQQKVFCAVAGAPEVVLGFSDRVMENGLARSKTASDSKIFVEVLEEFAKRGFRVVAFGHKHLEKSRPLDSINNLVFGGFFAIEDAVRPQAKLAVQAAQEAGLKVVMITGDLKITARSIAAEAGIFKPGDEVIVGEQLDKMSPNELHEVLPKVSVFARVTPEDKMKIIKAYKEEGQIIGMTGDGVNDAPSLVAADLGVAMGKIGTEVAKEAADIVLLDDNLKSIVTAIKEGRVMRANIKKSLQFLFSTSLGELLTISMSIFLGLPLPVTAVQILWLNMITDPLSGAALALEEEEEDVLKKRESNLERFFLDASTISHMVLVSLLMAVGAIFIYNSYYLADPVKAQTMALTLLAAFQLFNAFNCRFLKRSIFNKRILGNKYIWLSFFFNAALQVFAVHNPWFNKILEIKPISFSEWVTILVLALTVILADELRKFFLRPKRLA